MSRYLVGIDLGTTNSALAYVDLQNAARGPATEAARPSRPAARRRRAGAANGRCCRRSSTCPARTTCRRGRPPCRGTPNAPLRRRRVRPQPRGKVPGRLVVSAKSWLCHAGVDRTAPLLPWTAPPDVPRLSPLEVSARYLRHIVEAWNHAPNRKAGRTAWKSRRSCSRCRRRSTTWPAT